MEIGVRAVFDISIHIFIKIRCISSKQTIHLFFEPSDWWPWNIHSYELNLTRKRNGEWERWEREFMWNEKRRMQFWPRQDLQKKWNRRKSLKIAIWCDVTRREWIWSEHCSNWCTLRCSEYLWFCLHSIAWYEQIWNCWWSQFGVKHVCTSKWMHAYMIAGIVAIQFWNINSGKTD